MCDNFSVFVQLVRLHFLSFDLEYSSHCQYDSVKVYYGTSANGRFLGAYCGSRVPADILSTGKMVLNNTLYVAFKSDATITKPGFRIRYSLGERIDY